MSNCTAKALLLSFLLATPALAQAPVGFTSKDPIEINADALEVRQQENVAVFTGNVIAVQGTTRLTSDVMTIYYKNKQETAPAAAGSAMQQSQVDKIDVEGNVLLSTPEETASGKRGSYDVPKQLVHLFDDVTLTRGQNVLKGDTLVYNFATGKSVVNAPNGGQQGRVRALFMPGQK